MTHLPFSNIFKLKQSEPNESSVSALSTFGSTFVGPGKDEKLETETYTQYGTRLCGQTFASDFSLRAYTHKVYHDVKKAQMANPQAEQAHAQSLTAQIEDNVSQIAQRENLRQDNKRRIGVIQQEIADLKNAIHELRVDPEALVRFRLCVIVLLLLSAFLFVFYSSTFYSAFFRKFLETGTTTASQAMFDPEAFALSWQASITQFLFVCLAPFIFMALGLVLHFFFEEKGLAKYIKSAAVLVVTLAFDILLAYKIENKLAEVEFDKTNTNPLDTFDHSFLQALTDKDFWIVIFCGFVVYMIWGLLFDKTYTSYIQATSTDRPRRALEAKIADKNAEIKDIEQEDVRLRNEISQIEAENKKLRTQLGSLALWDPVEVRTCLMQFFAGWAGVMPALGKTTDEQQSAKNTFDHEIDVLFPKTTTPAP